MPLKQKLLKTIATGLTLAALSGIPAYAFHNDENYGITDDNSFAFGDVDRDGLTDMIVGSKSAVMYFRNKGGANFEYKQKIHTLKNKEKPHVALIRINGKLELIIMSGHEFKTYRVNNGRFEEYEYQFEPMWMEDEEFEEELKPPKDAI